MVKSTADFIINRKGGSRRQGVFVSSLCLEANCCSSHAW